MNQFLHFEGQIGRTIAVYPVKVKNLKRYSPFSFLAIAGNFLYLKGKPIDWGNNWFNRVQIFLSS